MKSPNIDQEYIFQRRKEIAQRLREIREAKGWNQEDLADHLGINRSTISKIEAANFNFGIDTLLEFSVILEFDIEILVKTQ